MHELHSEGFNFFKDKIHEVKIGVRDPIGDFMSILPKM